MNDRRFYSVNKGKSSFARYFLGAVIMTALIFFAIPLSQLLEDVVRQQLPPEVVDIPSEPPPPPPPPSSATRSAGPRAASPLPSRALMPGSYKTKQQIPSPIHF